MVRDDLELKVKRAVLNIEKKINGIYDILCDLSMKLCHIIEDRKIDYDISKGSGYLK